MAKRYTDSDKWSKTFFKKLDYTYKLLWLYLCDAVDHAGIWHYEPEIANIRIGYNYDWPYALEVFGDKVYIFDDGEKVFIPSFVDFQQKGELNPKNKCHNSIIKRLKKYDLLEVYTDYLKEKKEDRIKPLSKPLVRGYRRGYSNSNSNSIDNKKASKEIKGEGGPSIFNPPPVVITVRSVDGIKSGVETWIKENTATWKAKKSGLLIGKIDPKLAKTVLHDLACWIVKGNPIPEDQIIDQYLRWINREIKRRG